MHETNPFGVVDPLVGTVFEIGLQIGARNHAVIDSVAVFLFLDGVKQIETGSDQHGIRKHRDTVREPYIVGLSQDG